MGQTWKYKTMFDLDMKEDSIGDILYDAGIEVISVDYDFYDEHSTVYSRAKELVLEHAPDFVMGYCYGSFPAAHCVGNAKLILLDPCVNSTFDTSRVVDIDAFTSQMHMDIMWKNENLSTSKPPSIPIDTIRSKVNIFLSEDNKLSTKGLQYKFFRNKHVEVIPQSSHLIMVEPARYTLVNHILKVMNA